MDLEFDDDGNVKTGKGIILASSSAIRNKGLLPD